MNLICQDKVKMTQTINHIKIHINQVYQSNL